MTGGVGDPPTLPLVRAPLALPGPEPGGHLASSSPSQEAAGKSVHSSPPFWRFP